MKKAFFVLTKKCTVLALCLVFTGTAFLGMVHTSDEQFGWQIEGYSWSKDSFSYTKRTTILDVTIGNSFPALYLDKLEGSSCGPAAATNILQYYDGVHTNLIPDSTPFSVITSGYAQTNKKAEIVADDLYKSMKTDKKNGTKLSDYKTGLQSYVSKQGLKVTYASSMDYYFFNLFSDFDSQYYIHRIVEKIPVSIVAKNIQYIEEDNFTDSAGKVTMAIQNITPSHIMIGYGYVKYNYYRNETVNEWSPVWYNPFRFVSVTKEVVFRTDEYLKVSFGNGTLGYLNMNKSTITDAFTSHITK